MSRKGLSILIDIDPQTAMNIAAGQIESVEEHGGVEAACLDLEAQHGVPMDRNVIKQAMMLGMTMCYVILGKNLKAVEDDMRAQGIDPLKIMRRARELEGDLKSEQPVDTNTEQEAQRATDDLLKRVSGGGKPTLH